MSPPVESKYLLHIIILEKDLFRGKRTYSFIPFLLIYVTLVLWLGTPNLVYPEEIILERLLLLAPNVY